jgi:hypothetical protein
MMLMLRDDPVIELFDSPDNPPNSIEAIDVENGVYKFCDEFGQKYIGVITRPKSLFCEAVFQLQPYGKPDFKNILSMIDRAELLEPNERFASLSALRQYLFSR